jgi:choline dehydrogenase
VGELASVVVVGAGSAGCLVAARLAQAGHRVVLVEAGPDFREHEPLQLRDGWSICRENAWGYRTEPDAAGVTTDVLRTKLVGGNAWLTRFALRNHPADYHRWDQLIGGGWSYPEVRDAFNAIERDLEYGTETWHGLEGPIPITRYQDVPLTEFDAAVQQGLRECGFEPVPDLNRPGVVGYGRLPMNSIDGQRVITLDLLIRSERNIELRAETLADQVLFEGQRAAGVRLSDGSSVRAHTVVLAAGVYGSPCILMRSGIGHDALLATLDIPVRANLPGVGSNLCDHPAVSLDVGYRGIQRNGPVLHTFATFASPLTADGEGPDLALWSNDPEGEPAEGWLDVVLLRPHGRGHVLLASTDPAMQPRIRLPATTDDDVALLSHGVQRAHEVLATTAIQRIVDGAPAAAPTEFKALATWVRANTYSLPHTVGTCAMGASPDDGAVVDRTGQVFGFTGLYVADASILPGPPTGFPHLVTLMMASRITADLLASPHLAS